eukprot:CAMPEP_0116877776 /NCGR_PEP_ID=MMETSP0463-20121206/9521_1 /TAXON_ID=181622 /ORGANISM="Strombidinopsis sp, Strain SopsisLIS2011" /LENGTH=55 /DNA_ID=CAMNT_0004525325 /DNA_START=341 /DNA_END=505 /DNA_ORIENTATION=+
MSKDAPIVNPSQIPASYICMKYAKKQLKGKDVITNATKVPTAAIFYNPRPLMTPQ